MVITIQIHSQKISGTINVEGLIDLHQSMSTDSKTIEIICGLIGQGSTRPIKIMDGELSFDGTEEEAASLRKHQIQFK